MKKLILLVLTACTSFAYSQNNSVNDEICLYPGVKASYPEGEIALYDYIITHYNVTPTMKTVNDSEVIVRLIVEKNGSYTIEGLTKMSQECKSCNEELIRVISKIDHFNPGQKDGKPVRSHLDIYFNLDDVLSSELSSPYSSPTAPPIKGEQTDTQIHTSVEVAAEFPGGKSAMMKFIMMNLKYPETAVQAKIMGTVYLKFVVEKTGELTDIKVVQGMPNCPECEKEAISILKRMPKWKPAQNQGKVIRAYYELPIGFKL